MVFLRYPLIEELRFMCCNCGFQMIPVAANDVAFSTHAVLLTASTLFQIVIYEVSRTDSELVLFTAYISFHFIALHYV